MYAGRHTHPYIHVHPHIHERIYNIKTKQIAINRHGKYHLSSTKSRSTGVSVLCTGVPTFSFYTFLYLPIPDFHPGPRPSTILAKSGYSTNFQVKEGIKEGVDILSVSGSI